MQGTYDRLRVDVRVVARCRARRERPHRQDASPHPATKEARKRLSREMLGCRQRHQDLIRTFRL